MSNLNLCRGNAARPLPIIASVNLCVLLKEPIIHFIVGEHWRVFDTTVNAPEETEMSSYTAFPRPWRKNRIICRTHFDRCAKQRRHFSARYEKCMRNSR